MYLIESDWIISCNPVNTYQLGVTFVTAHPSKHFLSYILLSYKAGYELGASCSKMCSHLLKCVPIDSIVSNCACKVTEICSKPLPYSIFVRILLFSFSFNILAVSLGFRVFLRKIRISRNYNILIYSDSDSDKTIIGSEKF